MANKLYLVPSDEFHHLSRKRAAAQQKNDDMDALMNHTDKKVKALLAAEEKKGSKMNISIKRVLYNQEQKKEHDQRPVRVEIVKKAKGTKKKKSDGAAAAPIAVLTGESGSPVAARVEDLVEQQLQ